MKKDKRNLTFDIVNYIIFTLITLACVFPFYYIFILTISNPQEITKGNVILIPKGIQFYNYINILKDPKILHATIISVLRTVVGTIITVFCSSFLAYILTKNELPLRRAMYRFVVITMYFNAGLIPWYITMKKLGLNDNFLLYILPGAVVPFYLILYKTYIEQLHPAIEESAIIDGAGYFTIFTKVIFPLSTPIVATIAVFTAVGQWNTFTDTLFLVRDQRLMTLQMLLYLYMQQVEAVASAIKVSGIAQAANVNYTITPTAVRMTISMIVVFPILIVYPMLQRYFVKGIMVGAIKG